MLDRQQAATKRGIVFASRRRLASRLGSTRDEALGDAAELAERLAFSCGGLVVAGLVCECLIALVHPPFGSFSERWGGVIADALVALGVIGEIAFSRREARCQSELTRRSNDRLVSAEKDAAAARRELAEYRSPRLFGEKFGDVIAAMCPFAETQFDLAIAIADFEITSLMNQVIMALQYAGLDFVDWAAHGLMHRFIVGENTWSPRIGLGFPTQDVAITWDVTSAPKLADIGQTLARAMRDAGVTAYAAGTTIHPGSIMSTNAEALHIMIGRRS